MFSESLINALLKTATVEAKDNLIKLVIKNINKNFPYNDNKVNHFVEMLVDKSAIKTVKDVNLEYIKSNLNLVKYNHEKFNIADIEVDSVDNIDCEVIIKYKAIEKVNEDRADISYTDYTTGISYLDFPKVLK
jgi:hypothetical protein